ncbi:MAG TPA: NADPH:quinone oxidoreductase family protein [Acidimicrobiales bacterium]|nr:NADPH:quinone oxidoreductase family protein [Acidimicrobiales bacterium]
MRAMVVEEFGPPESIRVDERPEPEPGPGQVRIRIEAAGVNYVDSIMAGGGYQFSPQLPYVPGSEVAGTVDAVGDGVTAPAVGDRVLASCGFGGFAEAVVVKADQALAIPDGLDAATAATVVQAYGTGLFALEMRAGLQEGESLLVTGAGGGVGLAAVDVGKALGARVIAAASSEEKRAAAVAAGADEVIDYTSEDLKARARELAGGTGVDVVYDPVGGELAEPCLRALGEFGRYLVIGFVAGIPKLPTNQVLLRNRSVVGVEWGGWALFHADENAVLIRRLLDLLGDGKLHPTAPTAFPLEEGPSVLARLVARDLTGKAVLTP